MSVDIRVPEQSLVSITPEKVLGSDVLVFILSWPLLIGQVSQVLSVLSMVKLNLGNWNSSQNKNWNSNEISDFLPQTGDACRVMSFVFKILNVFLASSLVVLTLEWVFLNELRNGAVAVGSVSLECTLSKSSEHNVVFVNVIKTPGRKTLFGVKRCDGASELVWPGGSLGV